MASKNTLIYPFDSQKNQISLNLNSVQIYNGTTYANETVNASNVTTADVILGTVATSEYNFSKNSGSIWSGIRGNISTNGVAQSFTSVKTFNGSSFVTETVDSNNSTTNDVVLTSNVGNIWYFGCANIWEGIYVDKNSNTSYIGGELNWEYWNGSSWISFLPNVSFGIDTHLNNNDVSGTVNCRICELCWDSDNLIGWSPTIVDGVNAYYIRATIIVPFKNNNNVVLSSVVYTRFLSINGKWQYWNGSSWNTFFPKCTDSFSSTSVSCFFLTSTLLVAFNPYEFNSWTDITINSINGRYVRYYVTSNWNITPVGSYFCSGYLQRINKTIYCSEINSRTITSAWATSACIINDNASDFKGSTTYLKLDSGNWKNYTDNITLTDTGESFLSISSVDVTNQLNSEFTLSSTNIELVNCSLFDYELASTSFISNGYMELGFSYEFDEVGQTIFTKTIRYPLQTPTTLTTTTYQTVGTFPDWDTFLPESNKNIRNIVIKVEGSSQNNTTSTHALQYRFDGGLDNNFGNVTSDGSSQYQFYAGIDISSLPSNIPHTLDIKTTNASARFHPLAFTIYITYDFDITTTNRVLNSILTTFYPNLDSLNSTSLFPIILKNYIRVQEPGIISLKQSSIKALMNHAGTNKFRCKIGTGTPVDYVQSAISVNGASQIYNTIFDSSSISFNRGLNEIKVEVDSGNTLTNTRTTNYSSIINYESDIYSGGYTKHNNTIFKYFNGSVESVSAITDRIINLEFANIPETSYYINDASFEIFLKSSISEFSGVYIYSNNLDPEGFGYYTYIQYSGNSYIERGIKFYDFPVLLSFKQYPEQYIPTNEIQNKRYFDIELNRRFLFFNQNSGYKDIWSHYTYHTINKMYSGKIIGYSGDGSGILVKIYCNSKDIPITSTTTTIGGNFSFIWYDDTEMLYATAERPDGVIVSSQKEIDATSYDINFSKEGTVSFGYIS